MTTSAATRSPLADASSTSIRRLRHGLDLHKAGDLPAAEQVYRSLLDEEPRHGDALNLLGTVLAQQGHFAEGLRWIEQALTVDGDNPTYQANHAEASFQLGCARLGDGKFAEAAVALGAALATNPGHRNAQLNLGVAHYRLGELEKAAVAFEAVATADPTDTEALHNLAQVRRQQGDGGGALQALWEMLRAAPDDSVVWGEFAEAFERSKFSDSVPLQELQAVAVALLSRTDVDHRPLGPQIVRLLRRDPTVAPLLDVAASGPDAAFHSVLFHKGGIEALSRPLVRLALERTILPDPAFELLFTRIRRLALDTFVSGRHAVPTPFLISLARQCFLNGYAWAIDANQVAQVEWVAHSVGGRELGTDEDDPKRLALIGCYVPLLQWDRAEEAVVLASELEDGDLAELVLQQILEPYQESQLMAGIPRHGTIADPVSESVQAQYEEHPYPRWATFTRRRPSRVRDVLDSIGASGSPAGTGTDNPSILVAGCGTGRHIGEISTRFAGSTVTAIDLSGVSLAYAARKMAEVGLGDAELMQADILSLGDWDREFDIVDSSGVLHHMADPVEGWRILADLVRPGGLMRIGLYSALARREVVEIRDAIAEAGFADDPDGIRAARESLIEAYGHRTGSPVQWRDFYSLEECRDLLFHVQEHQFTIPEISGILDDLGVEFLGFEVPDPSVRSRFVERFPEEGALGDLEKWHLFESEHPDIFTGMYQLWVEKS